jgi:hypothetical protein
MRFSVIRTQKAWFLCFLAVLAAGTISFSLPVSQAARPVKVPNSTKGSKKCFDDVQNRFGGHFRVFVTKGRNRILCRRAAQIVRAGIDVHGWRYFDWTKGGNGPWSDVWERRDGRVVIAAILRCVEGLDNDDDLPPCAEELGPKSSASWRRTNTSRRRSYTIRTDGGWIKRIGPFRPHGIGRGSPADAAAVFGAPSAVSPLSYGCRIDWRHLRFRAVFANFGGGSRCEDASLQEATIRSSRFRTTRGIRVGSRSEVIPEKHSNAEFKESAWWIASVYLPYGVGHEQPTIRALVRNGKVHSLKLWVGAAGE